MSSLKAVLSALLLLNCFSQAAAQQQQGRCLSDPIDLEGNGSVLLQQSLNLDQGTFTMRLTFNGGQSWVGVAVNTADRQDMFPAIAVIGRMQSDGPSAMRYSLESSAQDGSGVIPLSDDSQTLENAVFYQTDSTSVLEFTQKLSDEHLKVMPASTWIYGVGNGNNQWEGEHGIHGSFNLVMTPCADMTPAATEAVGSTEAAQGTDPTTPVTQAARGTDPTPSTTDAQGTEATRGTDSTGASTTAATVIHHVEATGGTDSTASATDATSAGTEHAQATEGTDPITNATEAELSSISEATNATEATHSTTTSATEATVAQKGQEVVNSNSKAEEPKPAELNGTTVSNTASEYYSAAVTSQAAAFTKNDEAKPTQGLWVAHGWVMAVAWGLLAPLAVGCAVLRRFASWFKFHFLLNSLVAVMTLIGFILAVVATSRDNDVHFAGETHRQVGLTIVILILVQFVAGCLRPALPAKQQLQPNQDVENNRNNEAEEVVKEEGGEDTNSSGASEDGGAGRNNNDDHNDYPDTPDTSIQRVIWEMLHRAVGMFMLGAAWYNCYSGYDLISGDFGSEQDHSAVFWGVAGSIGGIVFLLAYVIRI